jgi:membrane associated rhomboid family serine protease
MLPVHRVDRRRGPTVFAGVVVVSLVVLFAPAGDVPSAAPGVDKVVHALLFGALAATGRWAGLRALVLGPALVAYAAGSEVLQGISAVGRTSSVADWLADVAGLCAGLALWQLMARRQRR